MRWTAGCSRLTGIAVHNHRNTHEISHHRLIRAIIKSNAKYWQENRDRERIRFLNIKIQSEKWAEEGKTSNNLLPKQDLDFWKSSDSRHEISNLELEYLTASEAKVKRDKNTRFWSIVVIAGGLSAFLLILKSNRDKTDLYNELAAYMLENAVTTRDLDNDYSKAKELYSNLSSLHEQHKNTYDAEMATLSVDFINQYYTVTLLNSLSSAIAVGYGSRSEKIVVLTETSLIIFNPDDLSQPVEIALDRAGDIRNYNRLHVSEIGENTVYVLYGPDILYTVKENGLLSRPIEISGTIADIYSTDEAIKFVSYSGKHVWLNSLAVSSEFLQKESLSSKRSTNSAVLCFELCEQVGIVESSDIDNSVERLTIYDPGSEKASNSIDVTDYKHEEYLSHNKLIGFIRLVDQVDQVDQVGQVGNESLKFIRLDTNLLSLAEVASDVSNDAFNGALLSQMRDENIPRNRKIIPDQGIVVSYGDDSRFIVWDQNTLEKMHESPKIAEVIDYEYARNSLLAIDTNGDAFLWEFPDRTDFKYAKSYQNWESGECGIENGFMYDRHGVRCIVVNGISIDRMAVGKNLEQHSKRPILDIFLSKNSKWAVVVLSSSRSRLYAFDADTSEVTGGALAEYTHSSRPDTVLIDSEGKFLVIEYFDRLELRSVLKIYPGNAKKKNKLGVWFKTKKKDPIPLIDAISPAFVFPKLRDIRLSDDEKSIIEYVASDLSQGGGALSGVGVDNVSTVLIDFNHGF